MAEFEMSEVRGDESPARSRKSRRVAQAAPAFFSTRRNKAGEWEVVDCEGEVVPGKRVVIVDSRVEVEDC